MRPLLFNLFFILFTTIVHAQDKKINGIVRTINNTPVSFANIIVTDTAASSKSLTYTSSNNQGEFSITLPISITRIIVNITAIGYNEKNLTLNTDTIQALNIYLDTSAKLLEEIIVKTKSITDTLNIGIDSMSLTKDATLRDILNKTEGVLVSKEGGISFQGKQINKVLINNKEVFLNQNKIALDNLNYEIMDNVQIITNYKDKFTLDFNRIQDPVINIKTKSSFKGVIKTQFDLGYGYKNNYAIKAKGFYFSDKLNVFITSNTNNAGQKELSESDVSSSFDDRSSGWLKNSLAPFFIENFQVKRNFVSNSSLTFRWQTNTSKTGLVFFHGNVRTIQETLNTTFIADTLIKKSLLTNSDNGFFLRPTLSYSKILSPKSVFQNTSSIIFLRQRQSRDNTDTLFVPAVVSFKEQTNDRPRSFALTNTTRYTKLLNSKTALELNASYLYESNQKNLLSKVVNNTIMEIEQYTSLSKQFITFFANLKLRFPKNINLNAGLATSVNNEKTRLNFITSPHLENAIVRKVFSIEAPVTLAGSFRKWDYSFRTVPVYLHIGDRQSRGFLKMSHSLIHNFEAQNNLLFGFTRNYRFFDLHSLFDTVIQTYNLKIISPTPIQYDFSVKEDASVSWFNSNAAKAKMIYFTYNLTNERNSLQRIFDSVSANTFYYSNRVFAQNRTHTVNAGGRKNFYIGRAYHRFDIGAGIKFTFNNYETFVNHAVKASNTSWEPVITWGLTPRNSILKTITGRSQWKQQYFNIDKENINKQTVFTNQLSIESLIKKIFWKIEYNHLFYKLPGRQFHVPDCDLSFKYELSEKIAFSLSGRSLLSLFELNNYNFVNIISDGNTLSQVITNNNLGYFLFIMSLKL